MESLNAFAWKSFTISQSHVAILINDWNLQKLLPKIFLIFMKFVHLLKTVYDTLVIVRIILINL